MNKDDDLTKFVYLTTSSLVFEECSSQVSPSTTGLSLVTYDVLARTF